MNDWEAALAAYVILSLAADTEAAGLAVVVAWSLAGLMFISSVRSGGSLAKVFSKPAAAPAGSPGGAPPLSPNTPRQAAG